MTQVRTVCGDVEVPGDALVDAHGHVWIDRPAAAGPGPSLCDEDAALDELRRLRRAGGHVLFDCQPGGAGRDGGVLERLAGASGVRLVAATGFHLRGHHGPGSVWERPDAALDAFCHELEEGLPEAPGVRAGLVKAAWSGAGGTEDELLRAAIEAGRRLGVPVVVHVEAGGELDGLLDLVDAAGRTGAVQLSHADQRPDPGLHAELARAGHVLGYDTFVRPRHRPAERVWPLLAAMLASGLDRQVTLGLDLVRAEGWSVNGGPGLRALPEEVLPSLARRGASAEQVRGLGGANALRMVEAARRAVAA